MIILKRRYSTTNCCHDSVLYLFFNSIQRENFIFFGLPVQNKWYCLLCCLMVTDEMLSLFCLLCLPCSFTTWVWMLSCPPHCIGLTTLSLPFVLALALLARKQASFANNIALVVCLSCWLRAIVTIDFDTCVVVALSKHHSYHHHFYILRYSFLLIFFLCVCV